MAFVKENIETEEQKKLFLSFDFRDCLGDPIKLSKRTRWYVDKENSLYLKFMGGGSFEIPEMFALMTQQGCIVIQLDVDQWNVVKKIVYSQSVHLPDETILQYVHEALNALINEGDRSFKNNEISLLPQPEPMDDFEETHYGVRKDEHVVLGKAPKKQESFLRVLLRAFIIAVFITAVALVSCFLFRK